MSSAIVAVGTELTDGQIINGNAAWLARRLKERGSRSVLHVTVPDDRRRIREALERAAADAELIVVTGGLGPTSDDFTRDVIAEWTERALALDDGAWRSVRDKLESRQYPIHDFQKQQCFFPQGAVILDNPLGTAHGFALSARGRHVLVLPGPPKEIAAIWDGDGGRWLDPLTRGLEAIVTRSWDCLGLGESQVAALVEPLLAGQAVESGYRVHLPYVEFKISFPRTHTDEVGGLLTQVEGALGGHIALRDGEDAVTLLLSEISENCRVRVIDDVTNGVLAQRLVPGLSRTTPRWSFHGEDAGGGRAQGNRRTPFDASPPELVLALRRRDDFTASTTLTWKRQSRESWWNAPQRAAVLAERRRQYFAEVALLQWGRWLKAWAR